MKFKDITGPALILILLAFVLVSCNYFSPTDNIRDLKEGKVVVGQFYADVKTKNINAANQLAADTLKKVIGKDGLGKIVMYVNKKLGDFKSYSVVDARSSRSEKSDNTLYKYKTKVVYAKTTVFEFIGLLKQGTGSTKIISYDVYSDMLK